MATRTKIKYVYGLDQAIHILPALPIVAKRNPRTDDFAQIGVTWVNTVNNTAYILTSISANSANWKTLA